MSMCVRARAHCVHACTCTWTCVCVYTFTKSNRLSPRRRGQTSSKWTETAGHSAAVGALGTLQSWLLYLGEVLVCAGQLSKVVLTS